MHTIVIHIKSKNIVLIMKIYCVCVVLETTMGNDVIIQCSISTKLYKYVLMHLLWYIKCYHGKLSSYEKLI